MTKKVLIPAIGSFLTSQEAMRLAISVAKNGDGFVAPNPLVGCVILDKSSKLLSVGFHPKVGERHAEADAVKNLPENSDLKGAQVYVTLEPCAHVGRTPSCAEMLAKLPIESVTIGARDGNAKARGGAEILRSAKKLVIEMKDFETDCRDLARVFFTNIEKKRAQITLKVATSIDGFIALKNGESQWITSEASRIESQSIRAKHQAIMVGSKTILIDDPNLNIRHASYSNHPHKLIVVDFDGDLVDSTKSFKIFKNFKKEDILVWTKRSQTRANHNHFTVVSDLNETLNLRNLSEKMFLDHGISSIMVEGGARLLSTALSQNMFDELHHFQAPFLIGGTQGLGWTKDYTLQTLSEKVMLRRIHSQLIEDDVYQIFLNDKK